MIFPDFCWRDTAFGGVDRRNNLVRVEEVTRRIPARPCECYATIARYPEVMLDYFNRNGQSVAGYPGPLVVDFLWMDLDAPELADSAAQAVQVVEILISELAVDPADVRIYFSGKKGFHVGVPAVLFGVEPGVQVPAALRGVACWVQDRAGVKLDLSIYRTTSLLRLPNTVNAKSGCYKIRVQREELDDLAQIVELAQAARTDPFPAGPRRVSEPLSRLYEEELRTVGNGGEELVGRHVAAPLGDAIPEGGRNVTLMSLAGSMRRRGAGQAAIAAALIAENREKCRPPLPDEEVHAIAAGVTRYDPADSGRRPARNRRTGSARRRFVSPPAPVSEVPTVPCPACGLFVPAAEILVSGGGCVHCAGGEWRRVE